MSRQYRASAYAESGSIGFGMYACTKTVVFALLLVASATAEEELPSSTRWISSLEYDNAEMEMEDVLLNTVKHRSTENISISSAPSVSNFPSFAGPSDSPSLSSVPSVSSQPSDVPSISFKPSVSSHPSDVPSLSKNPSESPSLSILPSVSSVPSDQPSLSVQPSDFPSVSIQPSDAPTLSQLPSESPSLSSAPSDKPSGSSAPSDQPSLSVQPSDFPSVSIQPSNAPSMSPVPSESPSLSIAPSDKPSVSSVPSDQPSLSVQPSEFPSVSIQPSDAPSMSQVPSESPSLSSAPSDQPSLSVQPSNIPSVSIQPSDAPSVSQVPSESPSLSSIPSNIPSVSVLPSDVPSLSQAPSESPSLSSVPSLVPSTSIIPSEVPSVSVQPSDSPSLSHYPSGGPSLSTFPSNTPSISIMPSTDPSGKPSIFGTYNPSVSLLPSVQPSISQAPSENPSNIPTVVHSEIPSVSSEPSMEPSISLQPSSSPSNKPSPDESHSPSISSKPSMIPSVSTQPSYLHSAEPSLSTQPSWKPSDIPTFLPSNSPSISVSPSMEPSFSSDPSMKPTIFANLNIDRSSVGEVNYNPDFPYDIKMGYSFGKGTNIVVAIYEFDCVTPAPQGVLAEESARREINEEIEELDVLLTIDENTITDSSLWTLPTTSYGAFKFCVVVGIVAPGSRSLSSGNVLATHESRLEVYMDLTDGKNLWLDNETYEGSPIEFTITSCQCDNLSFGCKQEVLTQFNNLLNMCIFLDTTEVEFAGVRYLSLYQGESLALKSVDNGVPNDLTVLTVEPQRARISTRLVSIFFNEEEPEPVYIVGAASLLYTRKLADGSLVQLEPSVNIQEKPLRSHNPEDSVNFHEEGGNFHLKISLAREVDDNGGSSRKNMIIVSSLMIVSAASFTYYKVRQVQDESTNKVSFENGRYKLRRLRIQEDNGITNVNVHMSEKSSFKC